MRCKEKFVEKRQFGIPLDTFVEVELSEKDAQKIREWINAYDSVFVVPEGFSNVIVLLNQTKLDAWHSNKLTKHNLNTNIPKIFSQ